MHPIPSTRPSRFSLVLRAALSLATVGMFGACDQHSPEEVPENYGHGSTHDRTVRDHQIDSRYPSQSFSDTVGTKGDEAEESHAKPAGSPGATPGGHFY